jgi:hypothetical protein
MPARHPGLSPFRTATRPADCDPPALTAGRADHATGSPPSQQ